MINRNQLHKKAKEEMDRYVEASRESMVRDIIDLVRFPSINGRTEETKACLSHFLHTAENMGFRTQRADDWDVGIVELGQGEETLGILVHLDVVDIGDPEKWTHDPFQGTDQDGFLYGRGTVDDKGAAIMSLYAMKSLARLIPEEKMGCKIWLIVGTSEEGHWSDMEHFKEQFPIPSFGFSPDGEFPIYHVEKGYADVVLRFSKYERSRRAKGLMEGEAVLFLQAGDSPNTIPSRAELQLVGGQKLIAHGISSHSSTPEAAVNAITKLCEEVCKIGDFDFARFLVDYFSEESQTKKIGIDDGSDHWNNEFIGTTTAVPTVLSLDQKQVLVNVNVRQRAGTTKMDIEGAFSALEDEYAFSYEINEYLDPMIVSKELPFVKTMDEVHKEYGLEGGFRVAAGTSYAKSMDNFVSWGPILLTDPDCAHMEDERLSIDTMLLATKMYARYLYLMTI